MNRSLFAAIVAIAMAFSASAAMAQVRTDSKIKGKGSGQIRVNDSDRGGSGTDLGVIDIEGRIYKPSVFYVLARGDIKYSGIEFKQSFLDRIVKGALKRPF